MSESSLSNRALLHRPLVSLFVALVLVLMLALPTAACEVGTLPSHGAAGGATTVDGAATGTEPTAVAHAVIVDLRACEKISRDEQIVKKCQEAVQRIDAGFHKCCLILRRTYDADACERCLKKDNDTESSEFEVSDRTALGGAKCTEGKCIRTGKGRRGSRRGR